jgi:hypothetical protein
MNKTKHQAVDGSGITLVHIPTPPTKIRLQCLEDVRREAARVYREARAGKIETADASRLSFMLQGIAKMIEAGSIERRIEALEAPTKRHAQSLEVEDVEVIRGQEPA